VSRAVVGFSIARFTTLAIDNPLLDYTLGATVRPFQWIVPLLETVRREPDESVPDWIRAGPNYESGLYDFDRDSTDLVVAWSYHLGEAFVRVLTAGCAGPQEHVTRPW